MEIFLIHSTICFSVFIKIQTDEYGDYKILTLSWIRENGTCSRYKIQVSKLSQVYVVNLLIKLILLILLTIR